MFKFITTLIFFSLYSPLLKAELVDFCTTTLKPGISLCKDGTVVFVTPASTGLFGMEGKCAHVLASQLIHAYCGLDIAPSAIDAILLKDITPGVLPSTLHSGMNAMFKALAARNLCPNGEWKLYDEDSPTGSYFIKSVQRGVSNGSGYVVRKRIDGTTVRVNPVGVLITAGESNLHWVMVVDVEGFGTNDCKVTYNSYGMQSRITCDEFTKLAFAPSKQLAGLATGYFVRLKFFTVKNN